MPRPRFVYTPDAELICNECDNVKQQKDFYRRAKPPGYLVQPCKACSIEKQTRLSKELGLNKTPSARAAKKRWLERNKEKRLVWQRKYYHAQNKAERNARLNLTGKGREYTNRRRALLANAEGSHTEQEWLACKEAHGNMCAFPGCGRLDVTRDHVVPLSRGGSDYIENIQPLCKSHNSSKLTHDHAEWLSKKTGDN